jgi:hypothetical protein
MLPRLMTRHLTAATLVVALILSACGEDNASDERAVKKAVEGVYDALADKDAKRVCDSISDKGKDQITSAAAKGGKKQTCEEVFGLVLAFGGSSLKEAKDVDVADVKVDGDQAKATVKLKSRKSDVGLIKEDGDWKLSGLDLAGS